MREASARLKVHAIGHRVGRGQMTVLCCVVGKPGFRRREVGGEQRTTSTLANHWVAGEARAKVKIRSPERIMNTDGNSSGSEWSFWQGFIGIEVLGW